MLSNSFSIKTILVAIVLYTSSRVFGSESDQQNSADARLSKAAKTRLEKNKEISFDLGDGVKMELVLIEPGSFMMGDDQGESEEKPAHNVTISKAFYMGKFEVTQEQWEAIMKDNPSRFKGAKNPVERASWDACQTFMKKLNEKFADSKTAFQLPTEAQWEYACRAGTSTAYGFGDRDTDLENYGWFESNADGKTHPVGEKKPNAWGLHDMHGNAWEWCEDRYEGPYGEHLLPSDLVDSTKVFARILRGGSWGDPSCYCRSAYRHCLPPWFCVYSYGFRVVCVREKLGS